MTNQAAENPNPKSQTKFKLSNTQRSKQLDFMAGLADVIKTCSRCEAL